MTPLDLRAWLADTLRGLEAPLVYAPNPGNAGDSVIASATYDLLESLGLRWTTWRAGTETRDAVVLYGGGGNLTPRYTGARDFLRAHAARARRLIVLPHTVAGHEEVLATLGPNVTLICREPASRDFCAAHAPRCEVLLGEDLGLGLDVAKYRRRRRIPPGLSLRALKHTRRLLKADLALARARRRYLATRPGERTLLAFRTDGESARAQVPDGVDVSHVLRQRIGPRRACDWTTTSFVRFLDGFDTVVTDRLHVCIVAALLGKAVRFHEGNYYKNRAVYEWSLARRFPKVVLATGAP